MSNEKERLVFVYLLRLRKTRMERKRESAGEAVGRGEES